MRKKATNYLLTDTLPSELPIIFSNRDYYEYFNIYSDYLKTTDEQDFYTIPIQFKVKKGENGFRTLSLMNPISQLYITRFINEYADLILLYFQQNSIFSIRVCNKINDHYIEIKDEDRAEIKAMLNPEDDIHDFLKEKFIRHFFNIIKYPKITDFYKSYYLKDIEIQYKYMLKLDIKSCFDNVYTHSLDWAYLGDKKVAKSNINGDKRISSDMDKVMQKANYNETHGILIGPEFSRVFVEIILTRVDKNIYEDLRKKGLYFKKHYEIVRFVDDIFVFASSIDCLEQIEATIKCKIEEYKFSLNDSKRYLEKVPFFREHMWVQKVKNAIKQFEISCEDLQFHIQSKSFYDTFWNEIRGICVEYESQIPYIISYIFSAFERVQIKQIESLKAIMQNNKEDNYESKIYLHQAKWVDLITQCLVLSISHKSVLKYSRMCIKYLREFNKRAYSVEKIIYKKARSILEYHRDAWTETQNIVIALTLVKERLLPPDLLIDYINYDAGYLSISTIAFYIKKHDPKNIYYVDVYKKINEVLKMELAECGDIFGINYSTGKGPQDKQLKELLCSQHFYILYDFYSSGILNKENKKKFDYIKKKVNNYAKNLQKKECYIEFVNYIKNFDKPFMKWSISEEELIVDFFLEKHHKNFQYD